VTTPSLRGWTALPSALVLACLLVLVALPAGSAAATRPTPVAAEQELARLLAAQAVRSAPEARAPVLQVVAAQRPITGDRTALPVLDHATDAKGAEWLRVRLPGRPNGRTGWIRKRTTAHAVTSWHIVVAISSRRVTVYWNGTALRVYSAIVGKPSTPTPRGEYFVEEAVALDPADAGAPYALALSARSNVFQEFEGGPGQVALHGLQNVGGVLGTAASHGCVRLDNAAMLWLVGRIGPGVPVTITG
jgi:lipoprotein-anchoring transpeptidase ErfK/SrfK